MIEQEQKYLAVLDEENKVVKIKSLSRLEKDGYSDGPKSSMEGPLYCVMVCNCSLSIIENNARLGWYLNEDIKKFVPPQPDPTYIFDNEEWDWKPNENLLYSPFGDGFNYRPGPQGVGWIKEP